jgi:hypothetical protein
MPRKLDPEKVRGIIESGEFGELVGAIEDERLECKAAPYQVEHEHQKLELAKDVSALANAEGGVILVGVETGKDLTHYGDEIKSVHPFAQELLNPDQYHAILGSWIYPTLERVEVRWFASAGTPEKGVVAIFVPKQPAASYPFLLTRTIDDRGKVGQVVFAYAERRRANAAPMSVQELHALVRDGLRFDSLTEQLETLRLLLEKQAAKEAERLHRVSGKVAAGRVEQALTDVGLWNKPAFILSAVPTLPVQIATLFERRDAPIVRLLEEPPKLREAGFDLASGSSARIVQGMSRRAMIPGDKLLELWRDGTLIFAAPGGDEFLGWGRHAQEGRPIRINPLALIESTYLFAQLSRSLYEAAEPRPAGIEYSLELRNMTVGDVACGLVPGPLGTFASEYGTDIHRAPHSGKIVKVTCEGADMEPRIVAFRLVSEIYVWFEIDHDRIPYTKRVGDLTEIDPEQIQIAGGARR